MKVYTKEELRGMWVGEIDDIINEMGDGSRYLCPAPDWPHRDATDEEIDEDGAWPGWLVAINLSDPTVRATTDAILETAGMAGKLPPSGIVILDIAGDCSEASDYSKDDYGRMTTADIHVYTLDSYKEKCRQHLESTRAEILDRLNHLDEVMGDATSKAVGVVESFITECMIGTDTSTETI